MRLYIAGPMTGIVDLNFPAFHAAAAKWRAEGYEVVNPAEINGGADELAACASMTEDELVQHWRKCMRRDIAELVKCDMVALLDGWTHSRGANIEHYIASALGMTIVHPDTTVVVSE